MSVRRRRWMLTGVVGSMAIGALILTGPLRRLSEKTTQSSESEWQRKFWAAWTQAEQADAAANWANAARLYGDVIELHPHEPLARYHRARALGHLGHGDGALEELNRSIESGWADLEGLSSEAAFAGIRSSPAFDKLVTRAMVIANEPIVVYVPATLDRETPVPLVITFHGRGENPHRHIASWKETADRLGIAVAAPRGIHRMGRGNKVHSFRWISNEESSEGMGMLTCQSQLDKSIELARQRMKIDENRILLAGYSEGGSVALAMLAAAPERFCGAVLQASSYATRGTETWKQVRSGSSVRVYFIAHELDRMRSLSELAYQELSEAGIEACLEIVPGADHELPMDNPAYQIEALHYVLPSNATPLGTPNPSD